jgi:hypothetical protein
MPSKPRYLCAQKDDLIWQKLEEDSDTRYASICTSETYRKVGNFILKYKDVKPESMHKAVRGGYNVVYRLEFEDKTPLIMRVPIKGIIPRPYRLRKLAN